MIFIVIFFTGAQGSDRLVILSLGLVNFILLIAAIAIGANCEYSVGQSSFCSVFRNKLELVS